MEEVGTSRTTARRRATCRVVWYGQNFYRHDAGRRAGIVARSAGTMTRVRRGTRQWTRRKRGTVWGRAMPEVDLRRAEGFADQFNCG
jgi:hypothetical protein